MPTIASPPTPLHRIPGPDACRVCGTPGLTTELVRDPFICGVGEDAVELTADVPVHTCSACDLSYTGEEAAMRKHEAVCRHLGLLTPGEIRDIRKGYEMSQAAFARTTGFGEATVARWERGEVMQNVSSDRYLRLLRYPTVFLLLKSLAEGGGRAPKGALGVPNGLSLESAEQFRDSGAGFSVRGLAAA